MTSVQKCCERKHSTAAKTDVDLHSLSVTGFAYVDGSIWVEKERRERKRRGPREGIRWDREINVVGGDTDTIGSGGNGPSRPCTPEGIS